MTRTHVNNHLLTRLSQDDTSLTPGEVVHPPERVQGQEEREDRDSKDVEHHPANHVPLASQDEHKRLQTVHSGNEDDGQGWNSRVRARCEVDEVDNLCRTSARTCKGDGPHGIRT